MPVPRPPARRKSSTISTTTNSRIQFQSYFCRGATNTPCVKCTKGWITGAEEIARHIRQWHECTNVAMETFYECPCSCPGAAFSTMGDLLLHISQRHPQRLSRHERAEQSPAPDDLEGDTEDVELESEEEGLTMVASRQNSRVERPRNGRQNLVKRTASSPDEREDSAWYEDCIMCRARCGLVYMDDGVSKRRPSSLPDERRDSARSLRLRCSVH